MGLGIGKIATLTIVLHLGGTPEQADRVWERIESLRMPDTPSGMYEQVREHLAAVQADHPESKAMACPHGMPWFTPCALCGKR